MLRGGGQDEAKQTKSCEGEVKCAERQADHSVPCASSLTHGKLGETFISWLSAAVVQIHPHLVLLLVKQPPQQPTHLNYYKPVAPCHQKLDSVV